jgi:hypothetical protein
MILVGELFTIFAGAGEAGEAPDEVKINSRFLTGLAPGSE